VAKPSRSDVEDALYSADREVRHCAIHGPARGIAGREDVIVWTHCIQFADGSIDDGGVYGGSGRFSGYQRAQPQQRRGAARELAALLIDVADEIYRLR
jgi:hypothetical protein